MSLTAVCCKHCENVFRGNLDYCPFCGEKSRPGRRDLLLKWGAVLVFLIVLAIIGYAYFHSQGRN